MEHLALVTGAPGWLGTRLVEALTGRAPELTRFSSIGARPVRALCIPNLPTQELTDLGAEVMIGDVRDLESLHRAMQGVETVFHCVGLIHPKRIAELFEVNTAGTRNALAAARETGVKRFVFVSSNSPAGCNLRRDVLLKEDDPPRPYKAYGQSKLMAEQAVNEVFRSGAMETVILRPCWFYGPNQPARQSRFFRMIKSGKPIIFGDGKNLRSMSYIDNTVQALLLSAGSAQSNGKTYWVADERPYQTIEIYQTVAELLGVTLTPRYIPALASTVCEWIDGALQTVGLYSTDFHVAGEMDKDIACSIDKAKAELGYQPTIDLREGMRRSLQWCAERGIAI